MAQRGNYPKLLRLRLFAEFPIAFLKSYLLRGDIMRGRAGFRSSMIYAISRFVRVVKALETRERHSSGNVGRSKTNGSREFEQNIDRRS